MSDKDNVLQLKKLAVKIIGDQTTIDDISGNTIAEVLDVIQAHYTSEGAGLTIVSAELNVDGNGDFNNGLITMSDGSTIDIIIGIIDTLTLTSEEGKGLAKTVITVSPELTEGNVYRYKIGKVITPAKNQDLSDWKYWNGTGEIEADNGTTLNIAECTANNKAVACGKVEVISPIF